MHDLKGVLKQALDELQPMGAQNDTARYQRLMKFEAAI